MKVFLLLPPLRYEAFQKDPKEPFGVDLGVLIEIFLTRLLFSLGDPRLKVHVVGNIFEHSIAQDTILLHSNIQDPERYKKIKLFCVQ